MAKKKKAPGFAGTAKSSTPSPWVGIIIGSLSDFEHLEPATQLLT
jgi:hypothetical protein